MFFLPEEIRTTSICPVLGTKHAKVFNGMCPLHTVNPRGKKLHVAFYGARPYITYYPVGGSDFILTRLLAKRYGFIPTFIQARGFDRSESNGTTYGLTHRVRKAITLL